MTQLGKRLISSAFFVTISVFTMFWAPIWFFVLVAELLVIAGAYEFFAMAEKKNLGVNRMIGLVFSALIPVATYYHADVLMLVAACLVLFVFNFKKQFLHQAFSSTAVTLLGIIYVAWFFSHVIDMRLLAYGPQWVFYTVLIVKGGDAGAYFVGKKFGKVKLLEHVSPNKSVEGAIGGLATTIVLSLISKTYLPYVPLHHFLFLGVIGGVISQLGDLGESLLKRDVGVKDSGQIPGLGGVFDVLDSLILTVPFVYYYVTTLI